MRSFGKYMVGVCSIIAGFAALAQAGDSYWNGTTGNFDDPAQWGGVAPGAADNANFANNATYTVTWPANASNANGYIDQPGGTITLNIGAGRTWTLTNSFRVGRSSAAGNQTVKIVSGTVRSEGTAEANDRFALPNSDYNTVLVDGSSSRYEPYDVSIFYGNYNQLIITNGGTFVARGNDIYSRFGCSAGCHDNEIIVTGSNSVFDMRNYFEFQTGSSNRYIIRDGGLALHTNTAFGFMGMSGTYNQLIVDGTGSVFSNRVGLYMLGHAGNEVIVTNGGVACFGGDLECGGSGNRVLVTGNNSIFNSDGTVAMKQRLDVTTANFVVDNGGHANTVAIYFGGYSAGSEYGRAIVTGAGSVWNVAGKAGEALSLGRYNISRGELAVRDGGTVQAAYMYVGRGDTSSGSTGICVVADAGSLLKVTSANGSDSLNVGENGQGFLTISNGGTVITPDLKMGVNASSSNNAIEINRGYLYVTNASANATMLMKKGVMTLREGGLVTANNLTVTNDCGLTFVFKNDTWGQIDVTGAFNVDPVNAKLTVDLSDYQGAGGSRTLVTYGSFPVQFAPGNITVIAGSRTATVNQSEGGNKVSVLINSIPRGTIMIVR